MAIKLLIDKLGPIRDSEIELKPMTLLTGNSNLGKSYVALAMFYFFYSIDNIELYEIVELKELQKILEKKQNTTYKISIEDIKNNFKKNILKFYDYVLDWPQFKCSIDFELPINKDIELNFSFDTIRVNDIEEEILIIESDNKGTTHKLGKGVRQNKIRLFYAVGRIIKDLLLKKIIHTQYNNSKYKVPLILPPSRGAISNFNFKFDELFNFEGNNQITTQGLYEIYLQLLQRANFTKPIDSRKSKNKKLMEGFKKILEGDIKVRQTGINYHHDEAVIPLTAAASSIKELFPFYYMLSKIPMENLSLTFEEPEAHLHPSMQKEIANMLSMIVNNGGLLQITTHSDYILNRLSNLVKLFFIKKKDVQAFKNLIKKLNIDENFILPSNNIGAYFFYRKNNYVKVENLNITEQGIPFQSFRNVVDEMIDETYYIDEKIEKLYNYDRRT